MPSTVATIAFAAGAMAAPASQLLGINLPSPISLGKVLATFDPSGAPAIFENASCKLEKTLFPGEPLFQLFGVANFFGSIIGPTLMETVGTPFVNSIDSVADQLCISAEQEPDDGFGICQEALQALDQLAVAEIGQPQADAFNCFLDLACLAPTGFSHPGTCQTLLAGSDCIANRLVTPTDPECCPPDDDDCIVNGKSVDNPSAPSGGS